MALVFETIMLLCFGASWPFNIAKSLRSRTAKGKSIYAYDPDGKAAQAYDKLTGEVLANERARDRERRALHAAR